jgi:hypothetical protein
MSVMLRAENGTDRNATVDGCWARKRRIIVQGRDRGHVAILGYRIAPMELGRPPRM